MKKTESFRFSMASLLWAALLGVNATAQQEVIQGGRFTRGTGTNAGYHSFAIPLDFQKGLTCSNSGGVAASLLPYLSGEPWLYHYNATNPASLTNLSKRIPLQNPIGAFGSRVGGTSLYIGQQYRFGIYAGDVSSVAYALRIRTWTRTETNVTYLGAAYIDLPWIGYTNEWLAFQTNGYAYTASNNGLTTIVGFENALARWGSPFAGTLTVTHLADSLATNKIYQVELAGLTTAMSPLVATGTWEIGYSPLYTLEFEYRPRWRAVFIDQPHFEGEPVPPGYVGKSLEELLTNSVGTINFSLPQAPGTYTNVDHSPELRRHPILDQFVVDMRRDPVALARFVHNEIALTDAISYNDNGSISEVCINAGGVSRGALGTFLEGQGAPAEQCALLVYLLRQAGVPAVYIYPPHNGLKMLDTQLSRALRIQLRGAVNDQTQVYTTNRQIGVNYPWVAAYIGTNWVHVFPWMKDTELIEGLNLYDYMSSAYNNGFKWMRDYALGKTNILSFAAEDDTPLGIYAKFLQNELKTSAPGLSLDDIGYLWRNRPNSYARWESFPKPLVTPTNAVALDSLSSSAITNVYAGLTNIFDTITVEVSSVETPAKKVTTGELRLADLHNRRLLLRHEKTGTNTHQMILSLAAFRTNATGPTNFTAGDALLAAQQVRTNLASSDTNINIRVTYKRHRALPQAVVTNRPNHWVPFPGLTAQLVVTEDRRVKKGDLAGICLDYGLVSRAMLNVHAQEIWNMERLLQSDPSATNTLSPDLYQGGVAYLMGMAYYERYGRFRELNQRLHKDRVMSEFAYGLSSLSAKRVGGQLPNQGDVILVQPKVDMNFRETVVAGNHTLHPDSGADTEQSSLHYRAVQLAELSAEEHHIIDGFFNQSNSISTVKLLQLAEQRVAGGGSNVVTLNVQNYVSQGNLTYNGTPLKNHDTALWASVTNFLRSASVSNLCVAYVTPGAVTNTSNSYRGMGALLFSAYGDMAALIGQNLNGGVGPILADNSFIVANTPNYTLLVDPNGNFSLTLTSPTSSDPVLAPDSFAGYDAAKVVNNASQDYYAYTEFQDNWTLHAMTALRLTSQGAQNLDYSQSLQAADGDHGFLGWLSDALGQTSSAVSDPVNTVTGEFFLTAPDLTLPGPMPLTISRNYSSLNLADSPFGYGWKLNYMPYLSLNADGTIIYAAEPDGAVLAYERTATNASLYLPTTARNPLLSNSRNAAIGSTANRLRNRIEQQASGPDTYYYLSSPDGSKRTFKVLTFAGSISRTRPYLLRWEDHRGNAFTFEYGTDPTQTDYAEVRRVQSRNGNYLAFQYDVYGHIILAYTGDGRRLTYEYDRFGDLIRVTFPDASDIQYEYEHVPQEVNGGQTLFSTHLLTRELRPDGRVLRNSYRYDGSRRVSAQTAQLGAYGNPVPITFFLYGNNFNLTNCLTNSITGYTCAYDAGGKVHTYYYTNGLITKIEHPLNRTIEQYWYPDDATPPGAPRSLWKRKDVRGLWTEFKYDAHGNLTNTVTWGDLTGDGTTTYATNVASYNADNLLEETIDPAGNKVRTVYDAQDAFLPAQVIKYAGATAVSTNQLEYYSVTNVFTSGGMAFTNQACGLLRRETRAFSSSDAAVTEWLHDGRGFITNQVQFTGTSDSNVVLNLFYNDRGELVEKTDADGRKNRFDYDGLGRQTVREVFEAGETVPLAWEYSYYNLNGELVWSDGPRFDPEDYVWRDYDFMGLLAVEIRWRSQPRVDGTGLEAPSGDDLFATTFFTHTGYGTIKQITDPRGAVMANSKLDSLGQTIQRKHYDLDGTTPLATNGFAYEMGGLVSFHTNAIGGVTETQYTTNGLPKYRRFPDGSTNAWRYFTDGRLYREIQRNGAYWETTYDDANRKTTRVFYSASGSPLATNTVELDRRGNVARTVDALGHVFTNLFDGLDRIKVAAGPASTNVTMTTNLTFTTNLSQQITTYTYDASGKVLTVANALGEKTITTRDALGRITRTEIRDANDALVRATDTTYFVNHQGALVTEGSGSSARETYRFIDQDGRDALTLRFSLTNRYECTLRYADRSGNPALDVHFSNTDGEPVTEWLQSYAYDGLNRLKTQVVRDDATTTFAYNALGNLTDRALPGGLRWQATYNNAGQITKDWNLSTNNLGVRTNTCFYYPTSSAFAGLLATNIDNRGVTNALSYDPWLRLATNSTFGALTQQTLTTVWQYDVRGLLTNATEQFTNSAIGPSTAVQRKFDAYSQLSAETVSVGGTPFSSAAQSWEVSGRRSTLSLNSQPSTLNSAYAWRADGLLASVSLGQVGSASYSYDSGGFLTTRTVGARTTSISSRDGTGRPLSISTLINQQSTLNEALTWTGDGLLASHTLERVGDFTDSRAYLYASQSRRLVEERLNLDATKRWTNTYTFDNATAAGPGVLTKVGQASGLSPSWSGASDAFSRVGFETNTSSRQLAYGKLNGPATVTAALDGAPTPVTVSTNAESQWPYQWRGTMEVSPGTHKLDVTAAHTSGQYWTNRTSWFTNNVGSLTVSNTHDAAGNLTQRIWRKPNGTTNLIQTLAWDGRCRLWKITERDSNNSGRDFTVTYDALGRRLRTTEITVTNGVSLNSQPSTLNHFFDPEYEFLELGLSENGQVSWKLLGPDFDGHYGSQNGTGGLDATVQTTASGAVSTSLTLSDTVGNVLGTFNSQLSTLTWHSNRLAAYGGVPGYRPLTLGSSGTIGMKYAWRNRAADSVGFVWMGANWLDPQSGRFLSFDLPGFDQRRCDSGYDTFLGDPYGYWDADGRFGKGALTWLTGLDFDSSLPISEQIQAHREGGGEYLHTTLPSFADQMWNNLVVSAFTPNSFQAMNDRTMGFNSPTVQYYNGMAQAGHERFGSPLAQTGAYDPNSSNARWGSALADLTTLFAILEGGRSQMSRSVAKEGATFGRAASTDYRATFFAANPELERQVVVHHAVEQQTLKLYPSQVTQAEIHSLENLRGIPTEINSQVHLSQIRVEWNQFYKANPNATQAQLLQKAAEIDAKYGSQFRPPVGGNQ